MKKLYNYNFVSKFKIANLISIFLFTNKFNPNYHLKV